MRKKEDKLFKTQIGYLICVVVLGIIFGMRVFGYYRNPFQSGQI